MKYSTSDLYTAAALIVCSGFLPDRLAIGHDIRRTIINVEWDDQEKLEPHLSKSRDGLLLVSLPIFKETHLKLKREVQDRMKEENERRTGEIN